MENAQYVLEFCLCQIQINKLIYLKYLCSINKKELVYNWQVTSFGIKWILQDFNTQMLWLTL